MLNPHAAVFVPSEKGGTSKEASGKSRIEIGVQSSSRDSPASLVTDQPAPEDSAFKPASSSRDPAVAFRTLPSFEPYVPSVRRRSRIQLHDSRPPRQLQKLHRAEAFYRTRARDEEQRGTWDYEAERLATEALTKRVAYERALSCEDEGCDVPEWVQLTTGMGEPLPALHASGVAAAPAELQAGFAAPLGYPSLKASADAEAASRDRIALQDWEGWTTASQKGDSAMQPAKQETAESHPRGGRSRRATRGSKGAPCSMGYEAWGNRCTTPAGAWLHFRNRCDPGPISLTHPTALHEGHFAGGWEPREPDSHRSHLPTERAVKLVPRLQGRLEEWCAAAVANLATESEIGTESESPAAEDSLSLSTEGPKQQDIVSPAGADKVLIKSPVPYVPRTASLSQLGARRPLTEGSTVCQSSRSWFASPGVLTVHGCATETAEHSATTAEKQNLVAGDARLSGRAQVQRQPAVQKQFDLGLAGSKRLGNQLPDVGKLHLPLEAENNQPASVFRSEPAKTSIMDQLHDSSWKQGSSTPASWALPPPCQAAPWQAHLPQRQSPHPTPVLGEDSRRWAMGFRSGRQPLLSSIPERSSTPPAAEGWEPRRKLPDLMPADRNVCDNQSARDPQNPQKPFEEAGGGHAAMSPQPALTELHPRMQQACQPSVDSPANLTTSLALAVYDPALVDGCCTYHHVRIRPTQAILPADPQTGKTLQRSWNGVGSKLCPPTYPARSQHRKEQRRGVRLISGTEPDARTFGEQEKVLREQLMFPPGSPLPRLQAPQNLERQEAGRGSDRHSSNMPAAAVLRRRWDGPEGEFVEFEPRPLQLGGLRWLEVDQGTQTRDAPLQRLRQTSSSRDLCPVPVSTDAVSRYDFWGAPDPAITVQPLPHMAVTRPGVTLPYRAKEIGSKKTSGWEDLPAPLVHEIAKRLNSKADIAAMRAVCKAWTSEAASTIQSLVLFKPDTVFLDGCFATLTAIFENIASLDLCLCHNLSEVGMRAISGLKRLKRLRMAKCALLCFSTAKWLPHLRGLQNLEELAVGIEDKGARELSLLTQLKSLNLKFSTWIEADHLKSLSVLTNLQRFAAEDCKAIKDVPLSAMLQGTQQLTHLNLRNCPNLSSKVLEALKHLPSLLELNLSIFRRMTVSGLSLLQHAAHVTKLNLGFSPAINDDSIHRLTNMTQLRALSLHGCCNLGDAGIEVLSELFNLESLNLMRCSRLTDDGARHLRRLPRLAYLNLLECPHISRDALGHLAWNLHFLVCDEFTHTPGMHPQGSDVKRWLLEAGNEHWP